MRLTEPVRAEEADADGPVVVDLLHHQRLVGPAVVAAQVPVRGRREVALAVARAVVEGLRARADHRAAVQLARPLGLVPLEKKKKKSFTHASEEKGFRQREVAKADPS